MKKATHFLFIFLLIFPPLAFGTVEQWSLTLMEGLSFFAFTLYLLERLTKKKPLYNVPGLIPLVLFLCYLLFQLIPLPSSIISLLSPETFKIYQDSILILDSDSWLSFSIDKKATLKEFFRYSAYFCFYFLTIQILTDKKKLKQIVNIVIIFLSVLSIFAIFQKFTSTDTIYWLLHVPNNSIIFGPYVNHNHFAGLVEMVLPIALSLFLYLKPQTSLNVSLRQKIIEVFDIKKSNIYILMGFSTVLLISAIVLGASRGALISICLALIIFVIILAFSNKQKPKISLVLIILAFVLVSISWFGWGSSFERFGELKNNQGEIYEYRLDFWRDSVDIAKDFPLTGIGFGNFGSILPRYRTFTTNHTVMHAHNDYLELFIEGGLIGVILVIWFLLELFFKSTKTYLQRNDSYSKYLFLGCAVGILSILFHSFTDFNLHIGANGLFFFFLLGLLVSSANTKIRGINSNKTLLKTFDSFSLQPVLIIVAMVVLVTSSIFNMSVLVGMLLFSSVYNMQLNTGTSAEKLENVKKQVHRALAFDYLESKYFFALANLEVFQNKPDYLKNYKRAIYYSPTNGEYLQRLGLVLAWSNNNENTERLLKNGCRNDISNPERYKTYADWLFSINEKDKAAENLKIALSVEHSLNYRKTKEYISLMVINDISEEKMITLVPRKTKPLLELADYFSLINKNEIAEKTYLMALGIINKRQKPDIWDFQRVYHFYRKEERYIDGLNILIKAISYFPDDVSTRIKIAATYEEIGEIEKAIEEYKLVLSIEPNNKKVLGKLSKLTKN